MRNRCFSAELAEDEGELVGQIRHYGDPLFLPECLAKTSGVPPQKRATLRALDIAPLIVDAVNDVAGDVQGEA